MFVGAFKILQSLAQLALKFTFRSHYIKFFRSDENIMKRLGLHAGCPFAIQGVTFVTQCFLQHSGPALQAFNTVRSRAKEISIGTRLIIEFVVIEFIFLVPTINIGAIVIGGKNPNIGAGKKA
ncbi:hypothetical protein F506_04985 [Herbaspirillum hiltneri N3]|uniref:Uncharacterized protein n=1 Tax=Herbaspirillum hiltneri N3 TaxID=1262470 RepID=A0ABM5UY55_9BURK|nr:hypothetical protein F506_04985 [Herbaspirillum hiltneri N3]